MLLIKTLFRTISFYISFYQIPQPFPGEINARLRLGEYSLVMRLSMLSPRVGGDQPPGNLTFSTCLLSIFRLWGLSSWSNFPSPGQPLYSEGNNILINRNIQQNHIELQNMHVQNRPSICSSCNVVVL